MTENGEQHLPYRKSCEEVIIDDDGRRWVREGATTPTSWADGVPVPRDKDGNVVPLATRKLYDGTGREVEVGEIALVDSMLCGRLVWRVRTHSGVSLVLDRLHLERPDTWERVEADLVALARTHSACHYFGAGADPSCEGCPAENCAESCFVEAARDVHRRCKAIAVRDAND